MKKIIIYLIMFIVAIQLVNSANCGGAINCTCGDTLIEDFTMINDMTECGANHGISIGGNGLTLDCAGYKIDGDGEHAAAYAGIRAANWDDRDLKIINCNISDFVYSIRMDDSINLNITNVDTTNTSGMYLKNIRNIYIQDLNVTKTLKAIEGYNLSQLLIRDSYFLYTQGVYISQLSNSNITTSYFQGGNETTIGLLHLISTNETNIYNNNFYNFSRGIYLLKSQNISTHHNVLNKSHNPTHGAINHDQVNNSNIHHNNINNANRSGIIASECNWINITWNNITCQEDYPCNISIETSSANLMITDNIVENANRGIVIDRTYSSTAGQWLNSLGGILNVTVSNNTITNFAQYGIRVESRYTDILNNVLTGNNTAGSVGIYTINVSLVNLTSNIVSNVPIALKLSDDSIIYSNLNNYSGGTSDINLEDSSLLNSSDDTLDISSVGINTGAVYWRWHSVRFDVTNAEGDVYVTNSTDIIPFSVGVSKYLNIYTMVQGSAETVYTYDAYTLAGGSNHSRSGLSFDGDTIPEVISWFLGDYSTCGTISQDATNGVRNIFVLWAVLMSIIILGLVLQGFGVVDLSFIDMKFLVMYGVFTAIVFIYGIVTVIIMQGIC